MIDLLLLATAWLLAGVGIAWIIGGAARGEEIASLRHDRHGLALVCGEDRTGRDAGEPFPAPAGRARRLGDLRVV